VHHLGVGGAYGNADQALMAGTEPIGAAEFLTLVKQRERGRLKVYLGSSAGTGKTYRMLNEAHDLRRRGIDVVVGVVETHGRADTAAQIRDLEIIPRRQIDYRGVTLEDMDLERIIERRPSVVLVDELAHTNVPGLKNGKRWQDVRELVDEGISVITTLNVQHLESLNDIIQQNLGVTVRETVPDWLVASADQVINLDISAEDLQERLREGKIYPTEKIQAALANFFTAENLTTLRELALREVASTVDRAREGIVRREEGRAPAKTVDRMLVAMSSDPVRTAALLRRASRIAGRLNSDWYCVYVQTRDEQPDRIDTVRQRKLVDNIQLAQSLGAEVAKLEGEDVAREIIRFAREKGISLVVLGQTHRSWWHRLRRGSVMDRIIENGEGIDVMVVAVPRGAKPA
jgi:two-component system sensor histidine kinase KdpD